jgi:ATP-dependent RNA helicase DbpA
LIIGEDSGFEHLIAQGKNGSGKTGAFSIGSTLRIDRKILKPQVLVLAHVRELSQQIADVYAELTKNTDIMVSNFTATGKCQGCHIVVSTIGKILHDLKGRKP